MRYIVGVPVTVGVFALVLNLLLAGMLVLTYNTLTAEDPVAVVKFEQDKADSSYIAHVYDKNGKKLGDFRIYADQWRIDAYFVKMKYLASLLGMRSRYALDRFEGRYRDVGDEISRGHMVYRLEDHRLIDSFAFLVDTTYGSSVFTDIKPGVEFRVLKSPTGLMVREIESAGKDDGIMDTMENFIRKYIFRYVHKETMAV